MEQQSILLGIPTGGQDRFLLDGILQLLECGFAVAGVATSGSSLIAAAKRRRPDVIVADTGLLPAAQQAQKAGNDTKLIALARQPNAADAAEAFRLGALGYVAQEAVCSELPEAIRQAFLGQVYLSPAVSSDPQGSSLRLA